MRLSIRLLVATGALTALAACGSPQPPPGAPSDSPRATPRFVEIAFDRPPLDMADVDCDALLTEAEVESVLGDEVTPTGRRASSCYWIASDRTIQLVFNTSPFYPRWRDEVLETYSRPLDVVGLTVYAEPEQGSVAAFGPDRGVILHGAASDSEALQLLLLALPRL